MLERSLKRSHESPEPLDDAQSNDQGRQVSSKDNYFVGGSMVGQ